jgi:hypothetical protein
MIKQKLLLRMSLLVCSSFLLAQSNSIQIDTLLSDHKVNDDKDRCLQYLPSIAVNRSGTYIIAWQDGRSGLVDIYAQRFDSLWNAIDSNTLINDDDSSSYQNNPSIAIADDGSYVMAWTDNRNGNTDIYAQRFDMSGNAIDSNILINDDIGISYQYNPSVAMTSDGTYIIVWQDRRSDNYDIYVQHFDASGNAIGPNTIINDDDSSFYQSDPSIAMIDNGSYLISWRDYRNDNPDIYAQRFDASGNAIGSNILINDDVGNSDQYDPSVALNNDGTYVITWEDQRNGHWDIYAQRFDASGNAIGPNKLINDDEGSNDQYDPSIAMNDDGVYVITWGDKRNGHWSIYAQLFNAAGTRLGYNYPVNSTFAIDSILSAHPSVKMIGSKIFTTWNENRNEETVNDVYCNILEFSALSTISPENSDVFHLNDNYPNPFNPGTTISYQLSIDCQIELSVFDLNGRKVATLINDHQSAGYYSVDWSASAFPSGIYLYRLDIGDYVETKKMVLIK